MAGRAAGDDDSVATFRTDAGRVVRGRGGVAPDVEVPPAPPRPVWHAVASDSLFGEAVADSVAFTLPDSDAERARWIGQPARWRPELLAAYLDRVRARLGVAAEVDELLAADLARELAARVAEVRWGPEAREELLLGHDALLARAVALFPELPGLLAPPTK
jgi:hypothetical protein